MYDQHMSHTFPYFAIRYHTRSSLLCLIKNSQCLTPTALARGHNFLYIGEPDKSEAKNQGEGESKEPSNMEWQTYLSFDFSV